MNKKKSIEVKVGFYYIFIHVPEGDYLEAESTYIDPITFLEKNPEKIIFKGINIIPRWLYKLNIHGREYRNIKIFNVPPDMTNTSLTRQEKHFELSYSIYRKDALPFERFNVMLFRDELFYNSYYSSSGETIRLINLPIEELSLYLYKDNKKFRFFSSSFEIVQEGYKVDTFIHPDDEYLKIDLHITKSGKLFHGKLSYEIKCLTCNSSVEELITETTISRKEELYIPFSAFVDNSGFKNKDLIFYLQKVGIEKGNIFGYQKLINTLRLSTIEEERTIMESLFQEMPNFARDVQRKVFSPYIIPLIDKRILQRILLGADINKLAWGSKELPRFIIDRIKLGLSRFNRIRFAEGLSRSELTDIQINMGREYFYSLIENSLKKELGINITVEKKTIPIYKRVLNNFLTIKEGIGELRIPIKLHSGPYRLYLKRDRMIIAKLDIELQEKEFSALKTSKIERCTPVNLFYDDSDKTSPVKRDFLKPLFFIGNTLVIEVIEFIEKIDLTVKFFHIKKVKRYNMTNISKADRLCIDVEDADYISIIAGVYSTLFHEYLFSISRKDIPDIIDNSLSYQDELEMGKKTRQIYRGVFIEPNREILNNYHITKELLRKDSYSLNTLSRFIKLLPEYPENIFDIINLIILYLNLYLALSNGNDIELDIELIPLNYKSKEEILTDRILFFIEKLRRDYNQNGYFTKVINGIIDDNLTVQILYRLLLIREFVFFTQSTKLLKKIVHSLSSLLNFCKHKLMNEPIRDNRLYFLSKNLVRSKFFLFFSKDIGELFSIILLSRNALLKSYHLRRLERIIKKKPFQSQVNLRLNYLMIIEDFSKVAPFIKNLELDEDNYTELLLLFLNRPGMSGLFIINGDYI